MHTHHHLVKGHAAFVCAIEIQKMKYTFEEWNLEVMGRRNTSYGFAYLSHAGSAPQLNLWEHLCHLFVCVMCMFLLSLSLSLSLKCQCIYAYALYHTHIYGFIALMCCVVLLMRQASWDHAEGWAFGHQCCPPVCMFTHARFLQGITWIHDQTIFITDFFL